VPLSLRRFDSTRQLLDELLGGATLGVEDLDEVLASFPDEDQYLDYKDGRITSKADQKQLKADLLRFVTGFANADGGVLAVGVTEHRPRSVNGAAAPGKETLVGWAARILSGVVGFFSPPPVIFTVHHSGAEVLVIAVARAPQLIPYVEAGELKYALRIGDSTVTVPPYLISDLVSGAPKSADARNPRNNGFLSAGLGR